MTTPRMGLPSPSEFRDPWFEAFEGLLNALDGHLFAGREDRNLVLMGGGTFSFDGSLLSWTGGIEIFAPTVAFLGTIPAAPSGITLQDGELLYVNVVRSPTAAVTVTATVATKVPSTDNALLICLRRGSRIYFRTGAVLQDGDSVELLQTGGAGNRDRTAYKAPVRVATLGASITLAGGAPNTLDGIGLVLNDRILVKDQTLPAQNGLHRVSVLGTGANGTWVRTTDADVSAEVFSGMLVVVSEGAPARADKLFELTTNDPIILGTTGLVFQLAIGVGTLIGAPGQQLRTPIPFAMQAHTDQSSFVVVGTFALNPDDYSVLNTTRVIKFQAVAYVTGGGLTGEVKLRDLTGAVDVTTLTFAGTTTPSQSLSAALSLTPGLRIYEVRIRVTGGAGPADEVFVPWAGFQIDHAF